ncbi:MAG: hypothetical protein ACAI34_12885 [Verrucomicrobium sp.]|nr:hypothetical protein [Verrucomicrobium sp.]
MFLLDEDQSTTGPERGYDREIVERVWETARKVAGNDPAVWRKDEHGAWIHRLAYRNRHSEFGWEIADCAFTLPSAGIAALRPAQWQNYLDFLVASRSSVVTADGLRNSRRLI